MQEFLIVSSSTCTFIWLLKKEFAFDCNDWVYCGFADAPTCIGYSSQSRHDVEAIILLM